jgi:hypothetical protein
VTPGQPVYTRPTVPQPTGSGATKVIYPQDLQVEIARAKPGDVLLVENGQLRTAGIRFWDIRGSSVAPITVWARNSRQVKLDFPGTANTDGLYLDGQTSMLRFGGLEITGASPMAPTKVRGNVTQVLFEDCLFYGGAYQPQAAVFVIDEGVSDIDFLACEIRGTQHSSEGHGLRVWRCKDVRVDSCLLTGARMHLIDAQNMQGLEARNSTFKDAYRGIYHFTGEGIPGYDKGQNHNLRFLENLFDFTGSGKGQNSVQFQNTVGTGIEISRNRSIRPVDGQGISGTEDPINMGRSGGTVDSPMRIDNNRIRGGNSISGSGIIIDGGHDYVWITRNAVDRPGNVGLAIAGGHYNKIEDNEIYSPKSTVSNVGIYVWDNPNLPSPTGCSDHRVARNRVQFVNKYGAASAYWDGRNCGSVELEGNDWDAPIGPEVFDKPIMAE